MFFLLVFSSSWWDGMMGTGFGDVGSIVEMRLVIARKDG